MSNIVWGSIMSVAIVAAGCGDTPIAPTPVKQLYWPQPHPSGEYGKEDQRYAPSFEQCPPYYWPTYNGHNWICTHEDGIWVEMPRREGYPR